MHVLEKNPLEKKNWIEKSIVIYLCKPLYVHWGGGGTPYFWYNALVVVVAASVVEAD